MRSSRPQTRWQRRYSPELFFCHPASHGVCVLLQPVRLVVDDPDLLLILKALDLERDPPEFHRPRPFKRVGNDLVRW